MVDGEGVSVGEVGGGFLTLDEPWPAMLRGIWDDEERYRETYWSRFEGRYFAGDGAKWDDDHVLWLLGRVDDVMNVSGHRISTTEVESALVSHPKVAEAAVVGAQDPTTGQAIVAFVTVRGSVGDEESGGEAFAKELRDHVAKEIGADRQAPADPHHAGAAQDPQRQDHAQAAARRRGAPRARRRDDAGRPDGGQRDQRADGHGQGRGLTDGCALLLRGTPSPGVPGSLVGVR